MREDLGLTDAVEIDLRVRELRCGGELRAGSLAQVNAHSLTGGHGNDARRAAWALLADGLGWSRSSPPMLTDRGGRPR